MLHITPQDQRELQDEVRLIQRFSESYRRKFALLIDQLNHSAPQQGDTQCLRLCVEAVDMMLLTQNHLAKALGQIGQIQNQSLTTAQGDRLRQSA